MQTLLVGSSVAYGEHLTTTLRRIFRPSHRMEEATRSSAYDVTVWDKKTHGELI